MRYVVLVSFLLIAALALAFIERDVSDERPTSITADRAQFLAHIESNGPEVAYTMFKRTYATEHFFVQHRAAHIFGEALYRGYGTDGVAVCDKEFAYGCYHGFFVEAVLDQGLSLVPALDTACESENTIHYLACQHGIGHGILEYLGSNELNQALEICKETGQTGPIAGCTAGVFMEYNIPLSTTEEGKYVVAPRPFDSHDPYAPCEDVKERYQEGCYHGLPQWWERVFDSDFEKLGVLCAGIADAMHRRTCFLGTGNLIPPTVSYDVHAVISWCDTMPTHEAVALCRVAAAGSFISNNNDWETASMVCTEVISKEATYPCPRP